MIDKNTSVKFDDIDEARLWRAYWDASRRQMLLTYKEGKTHYPINQVKQFISWMVDVKEEQNGKVIVVSFNKLNELGKPHAIADVFGRLNSRCPELFSPQGYERFDDVMCPRPNPNKGGDNQEDDKDRELHEEMINKENRKYFTATAVSSSPGSQKSK